MLAVASVHAAFFTKYQNPQYAMTFECKSHFTKLIVQEELHLEIYIISNDTFLVPRCEVGLVFTDVISIA